jgi:DNA-binding PadR family transcriptional regulator
MAKRRKVGNLLALAVLSALVQRPMHPYEMASVLRARGKDQDMPIKWGSLYTVVGNLEKHGFVAAGESVRQGGRPERTVYAITDAGRAELTDWVRELLATPEPEQPRFAAALSVLAAIPPDDAVGLLRERLVGLHEQLATGRAALAELAGEIPRLFLVENEYELAIRQAEADWVAALEAELSSGTFPGQQVWQRFHETGELPADIAALAERGGTEE